MVTIQIPEDKIDLNKLEPSLLKDVYCLKPFYLERADSFLNACCAISRVTDDDSVDILNIETNERYRLRLTQIVYIFLK